MTVADVVKIPKANLATCGWPGETGINLDANANAPVTPTVAAAIGSALAGPTNPSSPHQGGDRARQLLAHARDAVASLAEGVFDDGVIFTSGCTEGNNCVLSAALPLGAVIITSQVEHASVLSPARALERRGVDVIFLPVDRDGVIDLAHLKTTFDEVRGPVLLSIQSANSETGVLQPLDLIASIVADRRNVLFHTDAAQVFGKSVLRLDRDGGPHVATVSGHKLHGPMGVGAMLLASDEDRIPALLHGGGQQGGLRAGTEPLPLIAGMAAACVEREQQLAADVATMASLTFRLERGILDACEGATINGASAPRLPNTSSIRFPGVDAMALVARLDAAGVMVSHGSACSSMRPTPSHVLLAMGLSEDEAFSSVRFSTSPLNSPGEIDAAVAIVAEQVRAGL